MPLPRSSVSARCLSSHVAHSGAGRRAHEIVIAVGCYASSASRAAARQRYLFPLNSSAPAAVPRLQQCNTSASPYIGEIVVNGTIHTQFLILIINGDVCVER
jgi:hypothetical protein